MVVRRLGEEAELELCPTSCATPCLTRLVGAGVDLVIVVELAGH